MIKISDALKLGAGAVVGAALIAYPAHQKGWTAGRDDLRGEAAVEALERIKNAGVRNANFQNLSDRDRCRVILRDSGLPVGRCDQR